MKSSEKGEQHSSSADNEHYINIHSEEVEEDADGGNAEECGYENEHKKAETFGDGRLAAAEDDDDSVKSSEKGEQHSYFADKERHISTYTRNSFMEIVVEEGVRGGNAEQCGDENAHKEGEKFGGDIALVRVAYEERRNDEEDAECRGDYCDLSQNTEQQAQHGQIRHFGTSLLVVVWRSARRSCGVRAAVSGAASAAVSGDGGGDGGAAAEGGGACWSAAEVAKR